MPRGIVSDRNRAQISVKEKQNKMATDDSEISNEEALLKLSQAVQGCAKRGEDSAYEYGHDLINERLTQWEKDNPPPERWNRKKS